MLTDKQKQMLQEAEKTMAQQKKAEDLLLRAKLEKQRQKDVFEAIQKLIDPVNEKTLLEQLPVIDTNSWPEVIEERYISKLCGFPVCTNDAGKNTKDPEIPDRQEKQEDLPRLHGAAEILLQEVLRIVDRSSGTARSGAFLDHRDQIGVCLIQKVRLKPPRQRRTSQIDGGHDRPLVTMLGELTIAESAESDEEPVEDDAEMEKKMTEFLPTTSPQVKEELKEPKPAPKRPKKVSPEAALARIRAKFGKEGNKTTKKPPILVEAKPLDLEYGKKVRENRYGGVIKC
ncbi:hypothetical protein L596_029980 [Steinernema carpocapsae]|uniref:Uncharacterized protein n=1 Tax=Steinernema carpocapsae TaxID=34508 RepID=A0A4U5LRE1_STECR|nr:hypothetical protein L596_029980 [Steinernema carpocapsae]